MPAAKTAHAGARVARFRGNALFCRKECAARSYTYMQACISQTVISCGHIERRFPARPIAVPAANMQIQIARFCMRPSSHLREGKRSSRVAEYSAGPALAINHKGSMRSSGMPSVVASTTQSGPPYPVSQLHQSDRFAILVGFGCARTGGGDGACRLQICQLARASMSHPR